MMGSFLERPLVHKDFQHNYLMLVDMCSQELDDAKTIFDNQLALAKTPRGEKQLTQNYGNLSIVSYVYF